MKFKIFIITTMAVSLTTFFYSCHDFKSNVDLIIYNANVFSDNTFDSTKNCIAIDKGKIILLGTDAEIRSRYWADEYIDARQNYVYPGFIDAHSHFTGFAKSLQYADLTQASSFEDILNILIDFRKSHPKGWLVGRGWDQNKWKGKSFPDNSALNKLFPGVPVVLTRIDGHAVLASEAAIAASGIDIKATGNEVFRNKGKATGIFLETMADKIRESIPEPTEKEIDNLILTAAQLCYRAGLTAVTDAGLNKNDILRLNVLQQKEKLFLRVDAWINYNDENINAFIKQDSKLKNKLLRVGAIKVYADGALGSRGACLKSSYTDKHGQYGIEVTSSSQLEKICKLAYDHNYQVNTHAIGDSAVSMVLNTYAKFLSTTNDRRWRIEHAQVVDPMDIGKFGKYKIVPSIQSTHATSDMSWAVNRLGKKRVKYAYAYQDLLKQNGWLPNGTDFPIENIDPLLTFYAAVFRKDIQGQPANGYQPENSLTRLQALISITTWAAKASFQEANYGEIIKGKMASFTILDKNLFQVSETELLNTHVLYTIINGKIVYTTKK